LFFRNAVKSGFLSEGLSANKTGLLIDRIHQKLLLVAHLFFDKRDGQD
jgi:hypothetical protein